MHNLVILAAAFTISGMRRDNLVWFALAGLLAGCGSPGPGANDEAIVGRVFVTTSAQNGNGADRFDVNLQPFTPPASACAGATRVVGACCFFAPPPLPSTQPPGSGTPVTEQSAGTIQIVDTTTGSVLGTYQPDKGSYDGLPADLAAGTWSPGDELTVSAGGDELDAFTVTGRALVPASAALPTTVDRARDLVVTWVPYPTSNTLSIGLLASNTGAAVSCTVPETQGTVTIDASLFASFSAGAACQATAIREADAYAQISAGRIEFASFGWASGFCTVQ